MRPIRTIVVTTLVPAAIASSFAVAHAGTPATQAAPAHAPGHVLVKFAAGTDARTQANLETANAATRIGSIPDLRTVVLSVPLGAEQHVVDALQRSGKVEYAELDGLASATTTPNDTYWPQQWGLSKINAPTAWNTTIGSSSVIVADLDTGIDYSHPDLQGKSVPGYDFINNDSDPTDDNGHGTGTAAIIAANSDNGIGITGLCWQCRLMPVKVLNSSASGTYSALANGITWATDHGARVINMSLGGTTASSSLQSAVQYAVDHGVVLVGASGNYGSTAPFYPAYYDGVISVAGTTSSDGLYSWSDYGSWVSLAAPGCDYTASLSGYTSSFCGTSASAPVVSGLAGLLAADTAATGAGITNAIESSSVPIGSQVAYGRVDAAAALSALASAPAPAPTTSPSPSPSPSPTPTAATSSATFTGSTTQKSLADSYSISTSTGSLTATVTFTRTSSMTVQLVANDGTVISQGSGASGLRLTASVQAGTYRVVVSAGGRSNYTLVVNFPQP